MSRPVRATAPSPQGLVRLSSQSPQALVKGLVRLAEARHIEQGPPRTPPGSTPVHRMAQTCVPPAAGAPLQRVAERAANSPMAGEVELVSARRARELFPPLAHDGPAIHIPGTARLDGRSVRDAMRRAAVRRGARVIEGTATIVADGAVRGVRVDDVFVGADAVIAAAGAWSPQLLEPIGVRVRIAPQRGQIMHLRLPGVETGNWPVVLPRSQHYILAFGDSRIVVGATREDDVGFDHRVTVGGMAEVLGEALSVAPGLAAATHVETRIGFRPVGPDVRPLLGAVPQVAGLVVVNGLGASGLTVGPYVGAIAARLARQVDPGIDLAPYDPLR
ncbi:oxidoreductase [Streptomyces avermitilis]|nr:oxidoreductase [Streptomyces avermitilis]